MITELTSRQYPGNIRELKKTCERLKVRRGKKIFSIKPKNIFPYHFDYDRFEREMNTWNRFIQPVIDYYRKENKFDRYKYKYQNWDGDSLEWIRYNEITENHKDHKIFQTIYNLTKIYLFLRSIEKDIRIEDKLPKIDVGTTVYGEGKTSFQNGEIVYSEDTVKIFEKDLKEVFDKSLLPVLLGYIYLKAEMTTRTAFRQNMFPPLAAYARVLLLRGNGPGKLGLHGHPTVTRHHGHAFILTKLVH